MIDLAAITEAKYALRRVVENRVKTGLTTGLTWLSKRVWLIAVANEVAKEVFGVDVIARLGTAAGDIAEWAWDSTIGQLLDSEDTPSSEIYAMMSSTVAQLLAQHGDDLMHHWAQAINYVELGNTPEAAAASIITSRRRDVHTLIPDEVPSGMSVDEFVTRTATLWGVPRSAVLAHIARRR